MCRKKVDTPWSICQDFTVLPLFLGKKKFIIITITISSVLKTTITIILLLLKFTRLKTNMMNAGVYLSV